MCHLHGLGPLIFFFLKPLECRVAYTSKLVPANCIPERLSTEIDLRYYIERSVQISIRAEPRPAYMHAFKTRVEEPAGADLSLFSGINEVKGKIPSRILFEAGKEWHVCFFFFAFFADDVQALYPSPDLTHCIVFPVNISTCESLTTALLSMFSTL